MKRPITTKQSEFIRKRAQTLGWRNRHSQDEFYPLEINQTKISVMQVQRGELEGTYGTGATVWPASVVLAKYLEKNANELVLEKNVVDLGAGTGITSIAAAVLGARNVYCTDGEPKVVQLASDNVRRAADAIRDGDGTMGDNRYVFDAVAEQLPDSYDIRGCKLYVQQYWWGSGSMALDDVDVVMVADCVLPKLYPMAPLVDSLNQLLKKTTSVALVSYEHRYYAKYDPRSKFRELAAACGLEVEDVAIEEHDEVYSVDDVEIWRVRRGQRES